MNASLTSAMASSDSEGLSSSEEERIRGRDPRIYRAKRDNDMLDPQAPGYAKYWKRRREKARMNAVVSMHLISQIDQFFHELDSKPHRQSLRHENLSSRLGFSGLCLRVHKACGIRPRDVMSPRCLRINIIVILEHTDLSYRILLPISNETSTTVVHLVK